MKVFARIFVLVCAGLLVACDSPVIPTREPEPTPTVDLIVRLPTPTAKAARAPIEPTLVPTLALLVADGKCPPRANPTPPAKPATFDAALPALQAYLNAGASAGALNDALNQWGYVSALTLTQQTVGEVREVTLLPNAGVQIVVTFADTTTPPAENGEPTATSFPGNIAVFGCVNGAYQMLFSAAQTSAFPDGIVPNPRIVADVDVTGDGLSDLSVATGECASASCYDGLTIVSTDGQSGTLQIISNEVQPVLFPTWRFVPTEQGKAKDLQAIEGTTSDIEAGPQRTVTDTWAFDGRVFTRTSMVTSPAVYRIHALHDGDEAFQRKAFTQADTFYQQVVYDPNLKSWESMSTMKDEEKVLAAFALLRLMQTSAVRNDRVGVQTAYDSLVAAIPASKNASGELYLRMGKVFYDTFTQTDDYARACDAVVKFAEQEPDSYGQLGPETFGYSNTDYTADDMCMLP